MTLPGSSSPLGRLLLDLCHCTMKPNTAYNRKSHGAPPRQEVESLANSHHQPASMWVYHSSDNSSYRISTLPLRPQTSWSRGKYSPCAFLECLVHGIQEHGKLSFHEGKLTGNLLHNHCHFLENT